jgi:hypothetical protein
VSIVELRLRSMTETRCVDFQVGGAIGVAIVPSAAVSRAGALGSPAGLTHGFRSGFALAIPFVAVGLTIAIPLLANTPRQRDERRCGPPRCRTGLARRLRHGGALGKIRRPAGPHIVDAIGGFGDGRQVQGDVGTVDYTTVEVGPGLFIVCWKEPEQGTSVTHFQDWNKLELLASVASGKGEFVQMLSTFAETRRRSAL